MNNMCQEFDPKKALQLSQNRVSYSDEQNLLDIKDKERTSVLPWRGQFSPQLVEHFIKKYTTSGNHVLDPFCGSGTVAYECLKSMNDVTAIDVNPAAVCLAKLSKVINASNDERKEIIYNLDDFFIKLNSEAVRANGSLSTSKCAELIRDLSYSDAHKEVLSVFLLQAFGDKVETDTKKIKKSYDTVRSFVDVSPRSKNTATIKVGDARRTGVKSQSVDYIITSPPYINVFNYHQNYRPIIEALGYMPLKAASSEMGANRKFRQNRYITAVQYCIDMAQFFEECFRVLKDDAVITIVLGRTSNIRNVPYKNGEMIAAIASEGMSFTIDTWNERSFLNRFGETIYEDVITLKRPSTISAAPIEIGRAVGIAALQNSLLYCPDERRLEIEAAIEFSKKVAPSPISDG